MEAMHRWWLPVVIISAAVHAATDDSLRAGNQLYADGNLEGARRAYEECLRLAPGESMCATNLASVLVDLNPTAHGERAEALYREVAGGSGAAALDASFNLGLLLQDRRTQDATREACSLYRRVLLGDRSRWDAWCNYAACLFDLGVVVPAFTAHAKAIVMGEGSTSAEDEAAIAQPLASLYLGLGQLLAGADGDTCSALREAEGSEVLMVDEADSAVDVCRTNARNALLRSLELMPSERAEHALASLDAATGASGAAAGGRDAPKRASPAFVEALFDDFAPSFDDKLSELEYRVPEIIGAEAERLVARRGRALGSALDAGCGTGLLGPRIRSIVEGALVGADISRKMTERAAQLGVYDRLVVGDLLDLGRHERRPFELIAAADVLVYFGDIGALLQVFASLLAAGGRIVFSCEALEQAGSAEAAGGWRMTASGRYAHSMRYVTEAAHAAGLSVESHRRIVPRMEKGQAVAGHLFVLARAGDAQPLQMQRDEL